MQMSNILRRSEVLRIIDEHKEELQKLGVRSLDLFGSVARDEAHLGSDVDVLVDLSRPTGLFGFIKIKLYLEDILHCDVDLGTIDSLREHLREPVLKEIFHAF
jgi:predicted nucleotidyltransferase